MLIGLKREASSSLTSQDMLELHLHGSTAVMKSILSSLSTLEGFRPAEPGEFTRLAFDNGRMDLTEVEGLRDLIESETDMQRKIALRQAGVSTYIKNILQLMDFGGLGANAESL